MRTAGSLKTNICSFLNSCLFFRLSRFYLRASAKFQIYHCSSFICYRPPEASFLFVTLDYYGNLFAADFVNGGIVFWTAATAMRPLD